jgi:hypothetical protein
VLRAAIKEDVMDIIYAVEKPSIAKLFSQRIKRLVPVDDLMITENPDETGCFYIGFQLDRYVMSPDGYIAWDSPQLLDQ